MIRYIYTLFIGLLAATFIGAGIATFYPSPKPPECPPVRALEGTKEGETAVNVSPTVYPPYDDCSLSYKQHEVLREIHARNVALLSLLAALVVMAVSLSWFKEIAVIADGLLLGGVFTLIYSIGWSFASGDKKLLFIIVGAGLAVAIGLGYMKFILPEHGKGRAKKPSE